MPYEDESMKDGRNLPKVLETKIAKKKNSMKCRESLYGSITSKKIGVFNGIDDR